MSTQLEYEYVKMHPHVGTKYQIGSHFGLRLMTLGESHYATNGEPRTPDFTQRVLREYGNIDAFFPKVVGLFKGSWANLEEREEFWISVLHYTFVQDIVGNGPRMRPTKQQWESSCPAFLEVLERHEPQLVAVLGKALWEHLPQGEAGPCLEVDGIKRPTRRFLARGGHVLAFGINHPSSRGWSYRKWTPWVRAAIEAVNPETGM